MQETVQIPCAVVCNFISLYPEKIHLIFGRTGRSMSRNIEYFLPVSWLYASNGSAFLLHPFRGKLARIFYQPYIQCKKSICSLAHIGCISNDHYGCRTVSMTSYTQIRLHLHEVNTLLPSLCMQRELAMSSGIRLAAS